MTGAMRVQCARAIDLCAPAVCRFALLLCATAVMFVMTGCVTPPRVLSPGEQQVIDRAEIEYPAGFELRRYVTNLTAPTALAVEPDGSLLVAEGQADEEPRIIRIYRGGKQELFYPRGRKFPFNIAVTGWRMYGPVGGMAVDKGEVYVSHRDENGFGVITALDDKGNHRTVVAQIPSQGDYGLSDLAIGLDGRLWFGVGTATNSGVVGLDNWSAGWVLRHPDVHDIPLHDLILLGYRFNSPNPMAGLFSGADLSVTGPFQPFGQAFQIRIPSARDGKPTGAICSISPQGGPIRVEARGVHNPRGIAFDAFGACFTDDGMEPRGTRPILHDPDVLFRALPGQPWYGWPDYTRDLNHVSDEPYQPPPDMIRDTGYPQVRSLIDERASNLSAPVKEMLVTAFPWMSGAQKFQFAPADGPFSQFAGSAIVALSGDRMPFSTSNRPLLGPGDYKVPNGYKVVIVDTTRNTVRDFIRNTRNLPASKLYNPSPDLLERPWDVKFGPEEIYILDFGRMHVQDGREHVDAGTGQIYRLVPVRANRTSQPATTQESGS
jgi:hypothetical protein